MVTYGDCNPTLEYELAVDRGVGGLELTDFGLLKKQCIVFGEHVPQPVDSINQVPSYHQRYIQRIVEKKLNIPTPIQSHLWSALFRGRSATCISSPRSGKTLSYLIPALSDTHFKDNDPDRIIYGDEGPRVVVVCSGMNKVYEIREHVRHILDNCKYIRCIFITKDNETTVSTKLLNGCELLVGTPGPLSRLIASEYVRFEICSLLVFDDADRSFTLQPEHIQSIVLAYLKSYKIRLNIADNLDCLLTAPMLVLADSWTKEVKNFASQYMKNIVQVFGDLYEAAIAHGLNYDITFIPSEAERVNYLGDVIHGMIVRGRIGRIAIVCSNDKESAIVFGAMKDLDVYPVLIDSTRFGYELPKLVESCKNHPRAITVITDDKIKETPQINFIETLVHYSMPDLSDTFRIRFLLMAGLIKNGSQSIKSHFLLSSVNGNHAHFLCQTLRRAYEVPVHLEKLKNVAQRPLCEYYCAFAFCPFKNTFCLNRHQFKLSEPVNKSLPMDGQLRFEITHIISANNFYIRIREFRDSKNEAGVWKPFPYQYSSIHDELQAFKDKESTGHFKPVVGRVYAVTVVGVVQRVRIVKDLGQLSHNETNIPISEETPYQLEVFFIDFGYFSKALSNQIIELPKHLRDFHATAFKSYLLGVKPTDDEIEWTHKPAEALSSFIRSNSNLISTGWIRLQRKGIFWIDNMKIMQSLKRLKQSIISWSSQTDLIESGLAEKNETFFPKVNTNHGELFTRWSNQRLLKSVSLAFLEQGSFEITYLAHFKSIEHFYVLKTSSYECLERLEKDLLRATRVPMRGFPSGALGIAVIKRDGVANCNRIRVEKYYPEDKMVEVFFLDWGETYKISSSKCFSIEEKFIQKLPFQAIKCSLFGIEGSIDSDLVYDFTRTPQELFKYCLVEKIDGTKEDGYLVRVWVETFETENSVRFQSLAHWIVDQGHAEFSDEIERAVEEFKVMPRQRAEVSDEEEDEDEITRGERICRENMLERGNSLLTKYIIENVKSDPVQFDINKLSRQKRLMLALKRLKETTIKTGGTGSETDDESDDPENRLGPISDQPIDLTDVLPYDPTSSESDVESDFDGDNLDDF